MMNESNTYQIISGGDYEINLTHNESASMDYSDIKLLNDVVGIWITGKIFNLVYV